MPLSGVEVVAENPEPGGHAPQEGRGENILKTYNIYSEFMNIY